MSDFSYPKYSSNQRQGKKGESFFDYFVHSKLDWIYRSVPQESDFGIDGYIDIVTNQAVTGQTIAVQIKCGDSYFKKTSKGGIRYDGDRKHLNYYLNCRCPVILLVLDDDCEQGKWVLFDLDLTIPSKNGWWIEIPEKNDLLTINKEIWNTIAGPVEDFSEEIKNNWKLNQLLDESEFGLYRVSKNEILQCDFTGINNFIRRLSRNKESLLKNRGTLEILIDGYNKDGREIYEIPEVRKWYQKSIEAGIPWFYFLSAEMRGMGLLSALLCSCDVNVSEKENKRNLVTVDDPQQISRWLEQNFINLNHFASMNGISIEIIREMSENGASIIDKLH